MSLVLNVEILGEFKKLTAATKGAQSTLGSLDDKIGGFAKSAKAAFASIGVGLSFALIARELTEATKAAIDDRKSQELLALAMENTGNATANSVKQAEKFIGKMQLQAGIADDELRPAYQKLFIATGDVTESNRLLQIALDASASTGKGLDVVAQAMAKSLAGNDTALTKLIPSLKGSKTPIDDMATAFNGASAAAANLDPYQKMQTMWGDIQEQIGAALLPALDKLMAWLQSPKGEETVQKVVDALTEMVGWLGNAATWVMENGDWLAPTILTLGGLAAAWKIVTGAVNGVKTAIDLARKAQELFNKTPTINPTTGTPTIGTKTPSTVLDKTGLLKAIPIVAEAAAILSIPGSTQITGKAASPTPLYSGGKLIGYRMPDGSVQGVGGAYAPSITNVTVNNNTGTMTGSDLTSILNKFANSTGTK